jgi:hypothetical protein
MFALVRFVGSGSWGGSSHGRSRAVAGGLEIRVLDDVNARSLEGFGCESLGGVNFTGFADGDCLWDLSLGRYTGDGKFDGETFLGRLWMVCLVWSGGEETEPGHVQQGRFSMDDTCYQTDPVCCIFYIEQWGFRYFMFQVITNGDPGLDTLGGYVHC